MSLATIGVPRRRGRPLKPERQRLSYWLKFRVTGEQAEQLFRLASASGKSLSLFIRERLCCGPSKEGA